MIGAVIYNGKNTMVADIPAPSLDLENKLHSIGIIEPAGKLLLKDEEENQIRIKLYATSPEEAHLLSLLTPDRSLMEANLAAELLQRAESEVQPRLKCGLLADRYTTLTDFFNEAKLVPDNMAQVNAVRKQHVDEARVLTDFQRKAYPFIEAGGGSDTEPAPAEPTTYTVIYTDAEGNVYASVETTDASAVP